MNNYYSMRTDEIIDLDEYDIVRETINEHSDDNLELQDDKKTLNAEYFKKLDYTYPISFIYDIKNTCKEVLSDLKKTPVIKQAFRPDVTKIIDYAYGKNMDNNQDIEQLLKSLLNKI